ncbi:nicotinate-nucleotide--dimethylbenzimidazole phosphoribosyltransferase [Sutcliffiella horikoshii]|uniref:Nicotinate-nucleotide--dimethylbenzimidazole phosphoribosyltransferase n=1 Tax=Sutcliffiella horikoshii TaxID=79883 RepID=A0ABM6KJU9_9BACI|nr:nicotinate-nucleotide--dimethylbenzimidazole phosphoribosyltransferase [Sutcliffiella horikoshii]ART76637.1 nicotinate-nucleotide--dimethylbenzimidazole phosphoribosyltransferase [Sutcliffiella horikoshii]
MGKVYNIKPINLLQGEKMTDYLNSLTKPIGSLGAVEEIAIQLAQITGEDFPEVTPTGIIVFAADHGVASEGVSAYPQEVTVQMVHNFLDGGAAINVLGKQIGAKVEIVDIGVAADMERAELHMKKIRHGTANFLKENAMTRDEAWQAIEVGSDMATRVIENGAKCLIIGEMGIGNTTSSSAILSVLSGLDVADVIGAGTGITPDQLKWKEQVIRQSLQERNPDPNDPIDILSKVGGLEIGGMVGAILAAAERKIPVLVDGFISTVAALLAQRLYPEVKGYLFIGHQSMEAGHKHAIRQLEKKPILDLGLRLGEGTGAALAFPILKAATDIVKDMATFESAGIAEKI